MQSWKLIALEPSAMRSPDAFSATPYVQANGAHLAATLYRQASSPGMGGELAADRVYNEVASRLTDLIEATAVRVDRDDRRELLTLEVKQAGGGFLPARSLSDGTLRFLALCVLDNDPRVEGLLCMEEPENGIHPERMVAMVDLVRGLAVDPNSEPGDENPFRQVIVNTHSPAFVQLQNPEDLLFAKPVTVRGLSGKPARTMRLLPLRVTWRTRDGHERGVGRAEVLAYLTSPPGTQLTIEDMMGDSP